MSESLIFLSASFKGIKSNYKKINDEMSVLKSEKDKNQPTKYFDKRLARRILQLRSIVENASWNIEVYSWYNTRSRRNERN